MKRRTKILFAATVILIIGGVGFWKLALPRILFASALNSFSSEPRLASEIRKRIRLVAFDKRAAAAFGGYGPGVFRESLVRALPAILNASPKLVVIDARFEAESQFDTILQNIFDAHSPNIVWGYSKRGNRFVRRLGFETLSLGHVSMANATFLGRKLQLIPLCDLSAEATTIPALGLLAFDRAYVSGLGPLPATVGCDRWVEKNSHVFVWTQEAMRGFKASDDYKSIPFVYGQGGHHERLMPIRYMGPEGYFHRDSLWDILQPERDRPPHLRSLSDDLGDKIVFVGVTVSAAKDRHMTEVGDMDGLEVQANVLASLMRTLLQKE